MRFKITSPDGLSATTSVCLVDNEGNAAAEQIRVTKIELTCDAGDIWHGVFHVLMPRLDVTLPAENVEVKRD